MITRNTERWNRTIRNWESKLVPEEKTENTEPKQQIILSVLAKVIAYLQIFFGTPWYFTRSDDIIRILAWKSHYYFPHGVIFFILAYATGSPLLSGLTELFLTLGVAIPVLGRAGMFFALIIPSIVDQYAGTNFDNQIAEKIRQRRAKVEREETDISDIPDDEYLVPDSEMIEFSGNNPIASLRKGESVLALGTTQRGKTSAIKTLAAQLRYNRDTAVVAHGSNDDYSNYFADELGTEVLSLNRDGGDVRWNLFREVPENATEAEAEMLFESVARGLIPQSEKSQPYFIDSARNIFVGLCMILWEGKENPDHADLYSIIFDLDPDSDHDSKGEQVKELLKSNGHPTAAEGIKPGEKGDTYSTLTTNLNKQLKGDFRKSGKFSFREYYENPAGSVVSVESPESLNTCKEMYGVLLDRASQTALDSSTSSYFVLDEIGKLGQISSLDDLAARGLKQRSRLIVGVQSVDAMLKVYNEDLAQTILGNMTQMISFESKTTKTTDYIQDRLGKRTEIQQSRSVGGGSLGESRTESEVRRSPIESSIIESMPQGVGIVSGPNSWWYLRWMHPDEAIPAMAESRGSVTNDHEDQQRQQQQRQQPEAEVSGWDDADRSDSSDWGDV